MNRLSQLFIACVCLIAVPSQVVGQGLQDLVGSWELVFDRNGGESAFPIDLTASGDTLIAFFAGTEEPVVMSLALEEDALSIGLDIGHAVITCTLYREESSDFAGLCLGAEGEAPTLLRRVPQAQE